MHWLLSVKGSYWKHVWSFVQPCEYAPYTGDAFVGGEPNAGLAAGSKHKVFDKSPLPTILVPGFSLCGCSG